MVGCSRNFQGMVLLHRSVILRNFRVTGTIPFSLPSPSFSSSTCLERLNPPLRKFENSAMLVDVSKNFNWFVSVHAIENIPRD